MGGIGKTLFGSGSESKSVSGNNAWGAISNAFSPALNYTTMGGNAIANLLGLSGGGGSSGGGSSGGGGPLKGGMSSSLAGGSGGSATSGLENWANSGGMQFLREQGNKQITSNQAARGLLNSGSTLTALTKYGQGLGSTYLNQYMNHLFDFARLGLGAGGVMTSAGAYSKGTSDGGKNGLLPSLVSAAASVPGISDYRLKRNIQLLYTRPDGLNVYEYDLFGKRTKGVMAHEVKEVKPSAYIPNILGPYHGVDYGKLGPL